MGKLHVSRQVVPSNEQIDPGLLKVRVIKDQPPSALTTFISAPVLLSTTPNLQSPAWLRVDTTIQYAPVCILFILPCIHADTPKVVQGRTL